MDSNHSISLLIASMKKGDEAAIEKIWQRYLDDLIRQIERRLAARGQKKVEAQDVASEAFVGLIRGIRRDQFAKLNDRHDLWQILVVMAGRRMDDRARRAMAEKRGGGRTRGESVFGEPSSDSAPRGLEQIADIQPGPDDAAEVEDELSRLLALLEDDTQRQIALAKLENLSNEEIAERLGISLRSVERKLGLIRQAWKGEMSP